jgi:hypothetical protein
MKRDTGHTMAKRYLLFFLSQALSCSLAAVTGAQDDTTNIRVNVDLVQLNVAVTDSKGNYISGLGPENFAITEDKIPERIATFEEGNEPARQVIQPPAECGCRQTGRPARNSRKRNRPWRLRRRGEKAIPLVGEDVATAAFPDCRRQCLCSFRYQQLHVPGLCVRAGCHHRFCSLPGRREQGGLLFLQPRPFP